MKSKGHFYISLAKSVVRWLGYVFLFAGSLEWAAILLIVSEFGGVLEEVVDKRG